LSSREFPAAKPNNRTEMLRQGHGDHGLIRPLTIAKKEIHHGQMNAPAVMSTTRRKVITNTASRRAPPSPTCPMTGSAPSAGRKRKISIRHNRPRRILCPILPPENPGSPRFSGGIFFQPLANPAVYFHTLIAPCRFRPISNRAVSEVLPDAPKNHQDSRRRPGRAHRSHRPAKSGVSGPRL
jgi:hypothetical protein